MSHLFIFSAIPITHKSNIGLEFLQRRSELLDAEKIAERAAIDPYIFQRNAYLQYRKALIKKDGEAEDEDPFVEDDEEDNEEENKDTDKQAKKEMNHVPYSALSTGNPTEYWQYYPTLRQHRLTTPFNPPPRIPFQ